MWERQIGIQMHHSKDTLTNSSFFQILGWHFYAQRPGKFTIIPTFWYQPSERIAYFNGAEEIQVLKQTAQVQVKWLWFELWADNFSEIS
jgi:hypothetical protein